MPRPTSAEAGCLPLRAATEDALVADLLAVLGQTLVSAPMSHRQFRFLRHAPPTEMRPPLNS
jgi:hypothetical protein